MFWTSFLHKSISWFCCCVSILNVSFRSSVGIHGSLALHTHIPSIGGILLNIFSKMLWFILHILKKLYLNNLYLVKTLLSKISRKTWKALSNSCEFVRSTIVNSSHTFWKIIDNISDCTKIVLLQFTDQIAKSRANRGN